MPSTGFVNATKFGLYVQNILVSFSTNCSIEMSHDTREVTNKQSGGNAEFRESKKSWSGSGEFWFAPDATYTLDDLYALWNARTMIACRWSTEVTGDKYYSGSGYITSISASMPVEDSVSFTLAIQGTGALTEATQT